MNLVNLQQIAQKELDGRKPKVIRVCNAAGCRAVGAKAIQDRLESEIAQKGLGEEIQVHSVGCMRLCSSGPMVGMDPQGGLVGKVKEAQATEILQVTLGSSSPGALANAIDPKGPFFAGQHSIVLEHCGKIEPERIESSIAAGAYLGLYRALYELSPGAVVDEIKTSGLRGRGGGGYPTGLKWATVAKGPQGKKYVICNADEGDPGAFMDRSILESDPHRVLEGMAIAGYAIGSDHGYIYVRGEYGLAIERLEKAIKQANQLGLLGSKIFDSDFNFRIDIRIGAGAYVCGEETALIASIEGGRGTPRPRPPYPAESGLWGKPTLINNVETFANVPPIVSKGGEWFASIGTKGSKGTKVFALAGAIKHSGLVEVPMGTHLKEIVEIIGGGAPDGGTIKAVQTGGPSGGCIPSHELETPVDYESLQSVGSMMGSGGMIVIDEKTSMIDIAKFFMGFCRDESCGKCVPCRVGTVQIHRLLTRIGDGQGTQSDLNQLETLCDVVKHTSLCGLGQAAPNPVLSTLRYYRNEYETRLIQVGKKPG